MLMTLGKTLTHDASQAGQWQGHPITSIDRSVDLSSLRFLRYFVLMFRGNILSSRRIITSTKHKRRREAVKTVLRGRQRDLVFYNSEAEATPTERVRSSSSLNGSSADSPLSACLLRVRTTTLNTEEMLAAFQGLFVLLIFSLVLNYTLGADSGCADWKPSGSQDVCCERCKPGNRLVESCGTDPKTLCTPCEPGTYTTTFDYLCLRCTQCIGKQITLKPCTISSDTVCGCKPGYRCGNNKCSFCVTECKEGEEPTKNGLCKKCPEGKFNDKIHSICKEWKKGCPDGQILGKGNATSDCPCTYSDGESTQTTLHVRTASTEKQKTWLPFFIAGGMAGLAVLFIIVSVFAYVKAQNKTEKKAITDTPDQDQSDESRIMVVEQEDCSCRHPEQEQGGSSESINTQDSESKLIV